MTVELALNQQQAAAALGVSVNHFKRHVRPYLHPVYIGASVRYRTAELQRYLNENSPD